MTSVPEWGVFIYSSGLIESKKFKDMAANSATGKTAAASIEKKVRKKVCY